METRGLSRLDKRTTGNPSWVWAGDHLAGDAGGPSGLAGGRKQAQGICQQMVQELKRGAHPGSEANEESPPTGSSGSEEEGPPLGGSGTDKESPPAGRLGFREGEPTGWQLKLKRGEPATWQLKNR